jgi:two-component system cell cycle response regulator
MTEEKFFIPILIVEDDPVSRSLLKKILNKFGYEVTAVENGREALQVLKEKFSPIVISDWMMPEMDGIELCKAIRNTDFPGYIFFILITSRDAKDDLVLGLEAGADDYLTKPFNHAELKARLNTAERILKLEKSLKEANEAIRFLSITDPLTNSYNRGYLIQRLPREISRAQRYGRPLSLIMSDLDHFKMINDEYGHQAGDIVLKKFVESITGKIRPGIDWMARYGGEEFILVLPETDLKGASILAERLRNVVSENVIDIGENRLKITASFGVTCFDSAKITNEASVESMIKEADACLYVAKKEGRNQVKTIADTTGELTF